MIEGDEGLIPDPDCAVESYLSSPDASGVRARGDVLCELGKPVWRRPRIEENFRSTGERHGDRQPHSHHANLAYLPSCGQEIGSLVNEVRAYGYEPVSLALPLGYHSPPRASLPAWDDQEYVNKGILLVGAEPLLSLLGSSTRWRSQDPRLPGRADKWLGEFESTGRRFVSDGRSETRQSARVGAVTWSRSGFSIWKSGNIPATWIPSFRKDP